MSVSFGGVFDVFWWFRVSKRVNQDARKRECGTLLTLIAEHGAYFPQFLLPRQQYILVVYLWRKAET
jgi:hypothetical protein